MEQNISSNVVKFFKCIVLTYCGKIFHTAQRGPVARIFKFKLDFPFRNSNMGQKSMSVLGPKTWNALPTELKSMNNLNTFKHMLKKFICKNFRKKKITYTTFISIQ